MNRDVLAKNIVVADAQMRRFAMIFQILRGVADDAAGVEFILRADFGDAGEMNVRPDDAMRAEFHALVNHGERPDFGGRVQLCFRMNNGGRMNHVGLDCCILASLNRVFFDATGFHSRVKITLMPSSA